MPKPKDTDTVDVSIDQTQDKIEFLQAELKTTVSRLQKYQRGQAFLDDALERVFRKPVSISPIFIKGAKSSIERKRLRDKEKPSVSAVIQISDLHIGKVTDRYNPEIARERIILLAKEAIDEIEANSHRWNIDELHIFMIGDIVEGETIFPGQQHLISDHVLAQATRTAPEMLSEFIVSFLPYVDNIKVSCVRGNHGRGGNKHSGTHESTNWDTVCYKIMRLMILGSDMYPNEMLRDRIDVDIEEDRDIMVVPIQGEGHLLYHGHHIKSWAGIPYYGIVRRIHMWSSCVTQPWKFFWIGHHHTLSSQWVNEKCFLLNGTTESANEYALMQMAGAGPAVQRIGFFGAHVPRTLIYTRPVFLDGGAENAF